MKQNIIFSLSAFSALFLCFWSSKNIHSSMFSTSNDIKIPIWFWNKKTWKCSMIRYCSIINISTLEIQLNLQKVVLEGHIKWLTSSHLAQQHRLWTLKQSLVVYKNYKNWWVPWSVMTTSFGALRLFEM